MLDNSSVQIQHIFITVCAFETGLHDVRAEILNCDDLVNMQKQRCFYYELGPMLKRMLNIWASVTVE